jgi:ribonuclease HII
MVTLVGIDEAGRGPVIGPLVLAGVKIKEKDEKNLKELGAKDSKLLSPNQRENLFEKILKAVGSYKIIILSPQEIDKAVSSKKTNLNWLEADNSAKIINHLKPDKAILDCPSNNIKKYTAYIKFKLKVNAKIIAEHKADFKYPVVSAASIIAKVTRDGEIEKIKKKIGIDFGSGYPADPLTVSFMEKYYNVYPEIFRKSWESYKKIINKSNQKNLFDNF